VPFERHTFRMEFMPVFLFVYIVGSLGGALLVPLWVAIDPSLQAGPNMLLETAGHIIMFFSPPYAALCALFMSRYFRYCVSNDGVSVHYLVGKTRTLPWSNIASVHPVKLGNLRYLRIRTHTKEATIWLPLFVRSEQHLGEVIPHFAPEGHAARALVDGPTS
jgi:hypothetical protein